MNTIKITEYSLEEAQFSVKVKCPGCGNTIETNLFSLAPNKKSLFHEYEDSDSEITKCGCGKIISIYLEFGADIEVGIQDQ